MKKRVRWLLLTLTLLIMYHPQITEASTVDDKSLKAYSFANVKPPDGVKPEKDSEYFSTLMKSEAYNKYDSKFKYGNSKLVVKKNGKKTTIDLEETVEVEINDRIVDTNVYKYHFWVRSNKLKSNSWCWKTEFFMGTRNPVGDGSTPSTYVAKGAKIDRLTAVEQEGTFFVSDGKATTTTGDSGTAEYGLTLYVIDVSEYVEEMWRDEAFTEYVYLQTVSKTYKGDTPQAYTSGTASNNFNMQAWLDATPGWGSSHFDEYVTHYNIKIKIMNEKKTDINFHLMQATTSDPYGENIRFNEIAKIEKTYSGFPALALNGNIKTIEVNGRILYLKGIRVQNGGVTKHEFYIHNDFSKDGVLVTQSKKVKTTNYSTIGKSGIKKDTFAGKAVTYKIFRKFKLTKNLGMAKNGVIEEDKEQEYYSTPKNGLDGKGKTYEGLVKYMETLAYKKSPDTDDVYLIYQEAGKTEGELQVTKNIWKWDDASNSYKIASTSQKSSDLTLNTDNKFTLKSVGSGYCATYMKQGTGNIKYYLKDATVEYSSDPEDISVMTTKTYSNTNGEEGIWDGQNTTETEVAKGSDTIVNSSVVVEGLRKKVVVTFNYYQPKTVYTSAKYFKHKMNGKMRWSYIHTGNETKTGANVSSTKSSTNYGTATTPEQMYVFRARNSECTADDTARFYQRVLCKIKKSGDDEYTNVLDDDTIELLGTMSSGLQSLNKVELDSMVTGLEGEEFKKKKDGSIIQYDIQYCQVDLESLAESMYGGGSWSTKSKTGSSTGNFYQVKDYTVGNLTVLASDVYTLFTKGILSGTDDTNCYKTDSNACSYKLSPWFWAIDLKNEYTADVKMNGYYGAEGDNWIKSQQTKGSTLPVNSGRGYSREGESVKFNTSRVKGNLAVAKYEVYEAVPTLEVNLMIGTGSKPWGEIDNTNYQDIKWLEKNHVDVEIQNEDAKQTYEYTIYSDLETMLGGRINGLADGEDFKLLPSLSTEAW